MCVVNQRKYCGISHDHHQPTYENNSNKQYHCKDHEEGLDYVSCDKKKLPIKLYYCDLNAHNNHSPRYSRTDFHLPWIGRKSFKKLNGRSLKRVFNFLSINISLLNFHNCFTEKY